MATSKTDADGYVTVKLTIPDVERLVDGLQIVTTNLRIIPPEWKPAKPGRFAVGIPKKAQK